MIATVIVDVNVIVIAAVGVAGPRRRSASPNRHREGPLGMRRLAGCALARIGLALVLLVGASQCSDPRHAAPARIDAAPPPGAAADAGPAAVPPTDARLPDAPGCAPVVPHLRTPMAPPASTWFADRAAMLARTQPDTVYMEAPICDRRIALTFDDGPDPTWTPVVLDVLAQHHVHATFFVVGQRVRRHPEVVSRMHDEGHTVGGHGDQHIDLRSLGAAVWPRQIEPTNRALIPILGAAPSVYRPPYGAVSAEQARLLGDAGVRTILWSIDSDDWRPKRSVDQIREVVLAHVHPGAIILLHSNRAATAKALPALIDALAAAGYAMVTVPELLGLPR